METIVALIGSPRKMGNCELAARYVAWEAGCEEVKLVRMSDKNILPCKACYRCLEGRCPLDDDYGEVLAEIIDADGVIVAVPSYFFGPNSSIKRFLDRGLQLYSRYDRLLGKPAVGIAVAGMAFGEGYTLLGIDNTIMRMGFDNRGTATLYGALPGEIFTRDENLSLLKDLGRNILSPTRESKKKTDIACTACGSSYFVFTGRKTAGCLICGRKHTIGCEMQLEEIRGTGVQLITEEELGEHREWLIGMRQRYFEIREELKKTIREHYRPGREV